MNGNTNVILISGLSTSPSDELIANHILGSVFVLNFFSDGSSASVSQAYILRNKKKQYLHASREFGGYNHNSANSYATIAKAELSKSQDIFLAFMNSLDKDPSVKISIGRFISAVAKLHVSDKVIDICICLESIFSLSTEIKFRFSLYNTLLSKAPNAERTEIFQLLKKLYDIRSKIVHGSSEGDTVWISENWPQIIRVAKVSIIQKIEFLKNRPKAEWQPALDMLALGYSSEEVL